jgi:hypothetical protein
VSPARRSTGAASKRKATKEALEHVLNAGAVLSNIAFNLAQVSQTMRDRVMFDDARRAWDDARAAYRNALAMKPKRSKQKRISRRGATTRAGGKKGVKRG